LLKGLTIKALQGLLIIFNYFKLIQLNLLAFMLSAKIVFLRKMLIVEEPFTALNEGGLSFPSDFLRVI